MVNGDSVIYDDKEKKAMEIISDLEREMLKRMDEAAPLEGKAEEIHQLVLGRIQDYFPNLKRQCFEKRDMKEIGCLLRDKNGVYHPLINRMVARLSGSSQFDFFQMDNNQNGISVTPEDFLANIIAHEYGHIVKNEFLRSVGLLDYSSVTDINSLKELLTYDEAFAFWFADSISRTRRNIHFVAQSYKHLNPDRLKRIYEQMPEPKFVVAVGACACGGGVFRGCYNVRGGIDEVIPVSAYIPGCPASPKAIIDGIVKLLSSLEEKKK